MFHFKVIIVGLLGSLITMVSSAYPVNFYATNTLSSDFSKLECYSPLYIFDTITTVPANAVNYNIGNTSNATFIAFAGSRWECHQTNGSGGQFYPFYPCSTPLAVSVQIGPEQEENNPGFYVLHISVPGCS